jgi:chitodextrinase
MKKRIMILFGVIGLLVLAPIALAADTSAPTTPTGVVAVGLDLDTIYVHWLPSSDDTAVTGYRVYRDGTTTPIATTTALNYYDNGLTASTTYSYQISAVDAAGNESVKSAAATGSTLPDTTAPTVPAGLAALVISTDRVDLSWGSSTDNVSVAGYKIYRDSSQIATTSGRTYSAIGLTASTTYSFAVAAFDVAGNTSALTTAVAATTLSTADLTPPSVPTGLSSAAVSSSQINLTWNASTDNIALAGYKIYRDNLEIATSATNAYSNTGLTASTTYTYAVAAYDYSGNTSGRSASSSATTFTAVTPAPTTTAKIIVVGNANGGRLINLRSNAKIKVVVLGGTNFKVADIDRKTVTFAGAPAVNNWRIWRNRDRFIDRVFEFRARDMKDLMGTATTTATSVEATFKATTVSGAQIELKTTVRVKGLKEWKHDREDERAKEEAEKLKEEAEHRAEKMKEEAKKKREILREQIKQEQEKEHDAIKSLKTDLKQINNQFKSDIKDLKDTVSEKIRNLKDEQKINDKRGKSKNKDNDD